MCVLVGEGRAGSLDLSKICIPEQACGDPSSANPYAVPCSALNLSLGLPGFTQTGRFLKNKFALLVLTWD